MEVAADRCEAVDDHPDLAPVVVGMQFGAGHREIEVDHPEQPPEVREGLRAVAAELGLLATGSSDFHGDRKPVRLGECTTSPEVLAALRSRRS